MKGTAKHDRQQIQDEIDKLQAQVNVFGSATGASVRIETTTANLTAVLRLAGEILKEATLPETEFEQARKRHITQLEAGKAEPQVQAFTTLNRTLYPFPKGDVRATLTTDEEIDELKNVKYEDAKAFYQSFYGASNGELAIVGDFDPGEAKKIVGELFGDWKSKEKFVRIKMGFEKIAPANQSIETPDKANAVFAASQRLRLSDNDPDYAALVFGNYMLGGGFLNSRLAQRIRVKDGLSYGISSNLIAKSNEEDGRFQVFAIAAPQNVAKVETAFREEIARMLKDGFDDKEVEADKSGWLQSRQVSRTDDGSLCGTLAGRDYDGRTLAWDRDLEAKVKSLTPVQITEAMRRHVDPAQITIIKAGDFKKAAASPVNP
jgi:zinc protease